MVSKTVMAAGLTKRANSILVSSQRAASTMGRANLARPTEITSWVPSKMASDMEVESGMMRTITL